MSSAFGNKYYSTQSFIYQRTKPIVYKKNRDSVPLNRINEYKIMACLNVKNDRLQLWKYFRDY